MTRIIEHALTQPVAEVAVLCTKAFQLAYRGSSRGIDIEGLPRGFTGLLSNRIPA